MLDSAYYDLFWQIQSEGVLSGNRVARVFVQDVPAARRAGGKPERITEDAWRKLFDYVRNGELRWEALPALIRIRSRRPGADWLPIASKQRMIPLEESQWIPMVESALSLTPRSRKPEAHVRWLLGQLQTPPGRVPVTDAVRLLKAKISLEDSSSAK